MGENPELPEARTFLLQAYTTIPKRRFWRAVVFGISLGALIAAPLGALLISHEGPWTGFLWDVLFRLPFVLICLAALLFIAKSARHRKWREALKGVLAFALVGSLTVVASLECARQLQGIIRFRRLQSDQVRLVSVECHSLTHVSRLGALRCLNIGIR